MKKINIWKNPVYLLAFGFGSGLPRRMPGTWGTLAAIPLYLLLAKLPLLQYLIVICVAFLLGIYLCHVTARDIGVHDYKGIVWDEFVGHWVTMIAAPQGWIWIILGFVLFRLFDIWKPWPICFFDKKIRGGLGIMLDDVLAAVYAWIILQLLYIYLPL